MSPILILLVGVVIVIGGVLLLRWHAFLVLILAALVVSALTPAVSIEQYSIDSNATGVHSVDAAAGQFILDLGPKEIRPPDRLIVVRVRPDQTGIEEVAELTVEGFRSIEDGGETKQLAVARVSRQAEGWSWSDDDRVIHPRDRRAAAALANKTVGERVAEGFGGTCVKIGILIAMAAIIGKCLLDSGAADRIVRSALKLFGERGAPGAFLSSGFVLGIPVFFDTVFYLMIPLGKALRMRTGRNYLLYVLTIVCGATMAHSLVPPTPGPLFVAEELGVDLGLMIIAGCIVGLFASGTGYLWALFANRRWELPLRESPDFSMKEMEALAQRDERELPPLWISLLPIVLPVVLIGGYTTLIKGLEKDLGGGFELTLLGDASLHIGAELAGNFFKVAKTLGNKNIALVISALVAMLMLVRQKRTSRHELVTAMQGALASGGVIILITAAGGAFGRAMQQTGVASLVRELPQGSMLLTLLLAFLVTTAVRTAQGSATVAMITAVGILSGLAAGGQLGFHPVYLALAIGCGSKPLAWMNDSGFWVICKMSGMTEAEGLKYVTPMSAAMGTVGLGITMLGAWLFPMAG